MDLTLKEALKAQQAAESGPGIRVKEGALRTALVYPSPYRVAMSSLGYLQIHRLLNARRRSSAERAMLPEPEELCRFEQSRTPLLTVERQRPVHEMDIVAISHAYELELVGLVKVLQLSGLSPLAADRSAMDPLVILGGPITFSNPMPSAPFADLVLLGEAEQTLTQLYDYLEDNPEAARGCAEARKEMLKHFSALPGFLVPSLHGDFLPPIAQAPDTCLPAWSAIRTPNTELASMMLIEPERGCHRGCTFCVMRRSTNGGMRTVSASTILDLVPDEVPRVGLVGAAVTDHPQIKTILRGLVVDRSKRIGISSLRADRLDDEFVSLLAAGGYRSMTVALDAASVRLRDAIEKNMKNAHIERAAHLAKANGMRHLKLYTIVGLPGETTEDLEELCAFARVLSATLPVVLGVSPFVPKFHTPLADSDFDGEPAIEKKLRMLRKSLRGSRVTLRGPGAREAYIEYRLAQGGAEHAGAAIAAAHRGGRLSDWKAVLRALPQRSTPTNFHADLIPPPTARRRYRARHAEKR